ncbi:Ribonuclease H [Citrus sinensis]|nr:Ribonuclease H [Citrus sinensis]
MPQNYSSLQGTNIRAEMLEPNKVYVDDMLTKSKNSNDHIRNLRETFDILRNFKMKLNPAKCAFGVASGKFLGFMKGKEMIWTKECEETFQKLKDYLNNPPLLVKPSEGESLYMYLAVSNSATSSVLVRDDNGIQRPIYYTSRALADAETRYSNLEKLALALVVSARRLRPYFQAHEVIVLKNQPLKQTLAKPDVSGRLVKWAVELGEFDIQFKPRTSVRGQAVADFIADFTEVETPHSEVLEEQSEQWTLYVDGASNSKGSGGGLIVITPDKTEIGCALRFEFDATNNEAEYEALLARVRLVQALGVKNLLIFSDSQLVVNQVNCNYEARDLNMIAYLESVPIATIPEPSILRPEVKERSLWQQLLKKKTTDFIKRNIICRFGVPHTIITDNGKQFDNASFKAFCKALGITNHYSSPAHPQANGQVEAANRVIKQTLKTKLEKAKGDWSEELPFVLWSYRTTPRIPTGETPFSLAFGTEAVVPAEIGMPTYRVQHFNPKRNDNLQLQNLDFLEEKRDQAMTRVVVYQGRVARYYNARVKNRRFRVRDLVLKKVFPNMQDPGVGTLGPNWEGPYIVKDIVRPETYSLSTLDINILRHAWNAEHLRAYYQ